MPTDVAEPFEVGAPSPPLFMAGPGRRPPSFTFVDLFAGIGGIRLGLERAGGRCVYSVEIDEFARRTYEANFGRCDAIDIRDVDPSDMPRHDVLAAGFPCQPFSKAGISKKTSLGRQHGFAEEKSGDLFFEIVRIAESTRPAIVFMENVKHLTSHDRGRTFEVIINELELIDYRTFHTILSSKYWVPQLRERAFMVAMNRDIFGPEPRFEFPPPPAADGPRLGAILDPVADERYRLSPALWAYLQGYALKHRAAGHGFGYRMYGPGDVAGTLSARYYKDGAEILIETPNGPPRKLTPIEAARLMGFPAPVRGAGTGITRASPDQDGFVLPLSDRQAWKQLGNSVVVPAVEHVAMAIAASISAAELPKG